MKSLYVNKDFDLKNVFYTYDFIMKDIQQAPKIFHKKSHSFANIQNGCTN